MLPSRFAFLASKVSSASRQASSSPLLDVHSPFWSQHLLKTLSSYLSIRAAHRSSAMDPMKSETHQPWETEPEGVLKGLVLEDREVFQPAKAVQGSLSKLVPLAEQHSTYCLSRLRFHPNAEKQLNNMVKWDYK